MVGLLFNRYETDDLAQIQKMRRFEKPKLPLGRSKKQRRVTSVTL